MYIYIYIYEIKVWRKSSEYEKNNGFTKTLLKLDAAREYKTPTRSTFTQKLLHNVVMDTNSSWLHTKED